MTNTCVALSLLLGTIVPVAPATTHLAAAKALVGTHQHPAAQSSGGGGAQNYSEIVGHWRTTRIVFESSRDDHLILRPDGVAIEWSTTASGSGRQTTGRWRVTGKELTIVWSDGQESSRPFTFYEAQLVFPNVQGSRVFWERLE